MPRPPEPRPGAAIAAQVRARGIDDPQVLDALSRFARSRFVPPAERPHAGADRALPIGLNQTISQPYIVALMTRELDLHGTERVLEIGTGSGYQTAILSRLAAEVYTIERITTLSLRARGLLDGLGITNIHYRIGDGSLGWLEAAPFDRILVTAGAPALPPALFNQLAEGGLLVAPLGPEHNQQINTVHKLLGQPKFREVLPCRFVKLIGEGGWPMD
ncbi:MAG: protein-L-isoaspartate(D-aspartate) O-methyltransferase [Isosphaeraceae bacterium]|nr:protein-L-isoaspartate(D-aspartate) O-methyltransferase [Isosphaeraceae bacterium]